MATASPYLLDSILALAALHLASLDPENRDYWLDAASRYQSQSCSGLSRTLPEITERHYEPAFVASVFILIFATGFPVISLDGVPEDPVSRVTEVRLLLSGTSMLFHRMNEIGAEGELDGWLVIGHTEVPLNDRHGNQNSPSHSNLVHSLRQIEPLIINNESPNRVTYQASWQSTIQAIEPWPKRGPRGGIMAWPLSVTEQYISLLQQGDWMARILFLHYAVGMHLMSKRWYVRDWGRRLVLGILEHVDEVPLTWRDTITWMKHGVDISDGRL
ncbi:hypothetical protein N7468_002115 [Penicillium chermesinum]|uniref:Uncharacterized protein n=1 Tax=Penicillium chermesinum TaxID=63820 RepID=A0A9W9TXP0_9EURO|nr:uncharacterized protein N7468_002115 [Penicillium chermesinum]KAJ5247132.1 hypothetical protein N7468_002115 [Penicillium chermesinum]